MKYLTPEIAAFYKDLNENSLARTNISCGIFQDCNYNQERPKPILQQELKKPRQKNLD